MKETCDMKLCDNLTCSDESGFCVVDGSGETMTMLIVTIMVMMVMMMI